MTHNTYFFREHVYETSNPGTVYEVVGCKFCNSRSGHGFYVSTQCKLRFNEKAFKQYLDFRNISQVIDQPNLFVRRFSDQTYSRRELIQDFKKVVDIEKTISIIKEKPSCCENLM